MKKNRQTEKKDWHPAPTEEEVRLLNMIEPYITLHGDLAKDAPKEVVEAREKLFELSLEEGQ